MRPCHSPKAAVREHQFLGSNQGARAASIGRHSAIVLLLKSTASITPGLDETRTVIHRRQFKMCRETLANISKGVTTPQ